VLFTVIALPSGELLELMLTVACRVVTPGRHVCRSAGATIRLPAETGPKRLEQRHSPAVEQVTALTGGRSRGTDRPEPRQPKRSESAQSGEHAETVQWFLRACPCNQLACSVSARTRGRTVALPFRTKAIRLLSKTVAHFRCGCSGIPARRLLWERTDALHLGNRTI